MFFQISVTPKAKEPARIPEEKKEPPAILVLAPFQPQAHIKLETTINNSVSSTLVLKNPSGRYLNVKITKFPPETRTIIFNTSEISIDPESNSSLQLSWSPKEAGSWRDIIQFTDSRRIKYDVSIVTIATSPKKGIGKGKQKLSTQSNEIKKKNEFSRTILMNSSSAHFNKMIGSNNGHIKVNNKIIRENKENAASNKNCIDNILQTPVKAPQINVEQVDASRTVTKSYGVLSTLNISDFQLTPLHPPSSRSNQILHSTVVESTTITRKSKIVPAINIINATQDELPLGTSKKVPDIHVINATQDELSLGTSKKVPNINVINATQDESNLYNFSKVPENNEEVDLRRETYTTTNPKFCKKIQFVLEEDEEEIFEDSLSPPQKKEGIGNFSAIINNMNFITPKKETTLFSPSACSTETRRASINARLSDLEFHLHNDTFNISGASSCGEGNKANNTYELLPTPSDANKSISSHRIFDPFEKKTLFPDNLNSSTRCSSPVPLDQTRTNLSNFSLRSYDNCSVKDILEANLWAKDAPQNNHSIEYKEKSSNLDMIVEENLNISGKTYIKSPAEKQNKPFSLSVSKETLCIEISPPKKCLYRNLVKKVSPIKHNKISKEKATIQNSILNKKKAQLVAGIKKQNKAPLSGIRVSKLSLSSLKNKSTNKLKTPKRESIVKLHNPDNLLSQICSPDVFAPTMTEDPFISHTHYFDEKFIHNQEMKFKRWLNALLTPPEHLDVDIETACVDVGKVWQSCRTKEMTLAESKEKVSARYHTDNRLNTLRKAACAMFNREEVKKALGNATSCVSKGILVVRQDRDLHRDIGLQKEILELFLSYNPLWLRIGLEIVYGETIPLNSNNDLIGLTRFLLARFFSDPFLVQTYSIHNIVSLKLPAFQGHINTFILTKFLCIVYFLDYAKRNKLIGHDPCLFHKKAPFKESREILLTFSRSVLSGIGDITKVLRSHNYVVTHKQTYLDEYDYAVKDLSTDLRDGVRLCRVMELITGDKTLTCRCRLPAISRLQKIYNVDVALTALFSAGYKIAGDITAKSISDGHREKTLSLLWQLIYKFQEPRFQKAAATIQKWWRAKLWFIKVKNYLINRKKIAAEIIQRSWKCSKAREKLKILREEREVYLKNLKKAVKIVELRWLKQSKMLKDRRRFLQVKSAAIVIQKWFRRVKTSRPYLQALQEKREAAIIIQSQWRALVLMMKERENYLRIKKSVITIQNWWRAEALKRSARDYYNKLKIATIFVQSKWRANKLMRICRREYQDKLETIVVIQLWWQNILITKKLRNDYLLKKDAVQVIKSYWIAYKLGKIERQQFIKMKTSAIIIQKCWIRYRDTKNDVQLFKSYQKATNIIQPWWRMIKASREYQKQRKSVIIIQNWWKNVIITNDIKCEYISLKNSAIMIQKTWKMKQQRRKYLQTKAAIRKIKAWYTNYKQSRAIRNDYLIKKNATVLIQSWWRNLKASEQCRSDYLIKRKAAIIIQAQWRAKIIGKLTREKYLSMKKASIKIQSYWRMIRARNTYLNMLKRHKAAIVLQRRWRARVIGLKTRENYLKQKSAVILIQRKYRAMKLAKLTKAKYLIYKKAAIIIQKNWRMFIISQNYQRIKTAVIILQTQWRAKKLAIHHRQNYLEIRKKIVMIQRYYRAKCIAQEVKTKYLKLYQTTVKVQRIWRANKRMKEVRRQYLSHRSATIKIQSWWRMIIEKNKYLIKKRAVFKIQIAWRSLIIARDTRNYFIKLKQATIFIQKRFRSMRYTKKIRNEFKKLKKVVIFVQQSWRRKQEARRQIAIMMKKRRAIRAATIIQAFWRGYILRKNQCATIKKIKERSEKARAAATPANTIAFRLQKAINELQNVTSVGQLSMCLACIDTLTGLSPKGCILFCQLGLVDRIYNILETSNRSLPWMEVCLRCTSILVTLIKVPQTSSYVKKLEDTETIARLMTVSVKRDTNLFLHLATLFWLLLLDKDFADGLRHHTRTIFLIKSLYTTAIFKNSSQNLKGLKNKNDTFHEIVLPNPKTDWGLKTKRPRYFLEISDAILTIKDILNIHPTF